MKTKGCPYLSKWKYTLLVDDRVSYAMDKDSNILDILRHDRPIMGWCSNGLLEHLERVKMLRGACNTVIAQKLAGWHEK